MLQRPRKKEKEDIEDLELFFKMSQTKGPEKEPPPRPLKKAETWIYSEKARELEGSFIRGEKAATDLSYADFGGMDLAGKDLKERSFKGSFLAFVSLEGSDLRGVDFEDADLRNINLKGADLSGANLKGANLEDADLTDANLEGALFDEDTLIKGAKLPKNNRPETLETLVDLLAQIEQVEKGELDIRKIPRRYLKYVNLRNMDLTGLDLSGMDLNELDLTGVNLSGVIFDARKTFKMDLADEHLKWQQYKGNRPVVKRWYEFPAIFDFENEGDASHSQFGDMGEIEQGDFEGMEAENPTLSKQAEARDKMRAQLEAAASSRRRGHGRARFRGRAKVKS